MLWLFIEMSLFSYEENRFKISSLEIESSVLRQEFIIQIHGKVNASKLVANTLQYGILEGCQWDS